MTTIEASDPHSSVIIYRNKNENTHKPLTYDDDEI